MGKFISRHFQCKHRLLVPATLRTGSAFLLEVFKAQEMVQGVGKLKKKKLQILSCKTSKQKLSRKHVVDIK